MPHIVGISGTSWLQAKSDIYDSKRSSAISEFFEKNPDKSIFYSGLDLKDADKPWERDYMGAFEWDFNSKCPISHPTIAYRKSVANEIKYHEERVLVWRLPRPVNGENRGEH